MWAPDTDRESAGRRIDVPVGVHVAGGAAVVVLASLAASVIPGIYPGWRVAVVALAVALFATNTKDATAAVAVAVLAWFVVNGFLVDHLGELSWHGPADLVRAIVLAAAAGVGLVWGGRPSRSSDRRNNEETKCRT